LSGINCRKRRMNPYLPRQPQMPPLVSRDPGEGEPEVESKRRGRWHWHF